MNNKPRNRESWWQDAYRDQAHRHVLYEIKFGKDVIKTGDKIKIKNRRGSFHFRCLVHNSQLDITWIDCIDVITREWRSFRVEEIKGLVKMKSRRRKINE
jgi:hypothetical protein